MGDPGHRLHPGPDRLARAHPRGGALPAHVRAVLVLHRRAEGGRGARPDDARRAHRGDAHLPLHADRRRGAPRALLQPLLRRGRRARGEQPAGPPRGDERAREPGVQPALRRDAQEPRGPAGAPARGPRDAGGGGHALPHGHRGDARPDRPALHPPVQRGGRARCRASSRASTTSPATSTATSPSARASCARWPRRTRGTATRSRAR